MQNLDSFMAAQRRPRTRVIAALLAFPAVSFAVCQNTNPVLQQQCINNENALRAQQQRAAQQPAPVNPLLQRPQLPGAPGQLRAAGAPGAPNVGNLRNVAGNRPVYTVPPIAVASRTSNGNSMLTPAGSASVLRDVNSARSNFGGINQRPIPQGQVTARNDGSLSVATKDGRQFGVRPNGTLATFTTGDRTAAFRGNGQIRSLHTPTMDIARTVHGQRTVVLRRPDHSLLVSTGATSGYLQRTVNRNGKTLIQRSYVIGNVHYARLYSPYRFHGAVLANYVPTTRYPPAFYSWARQSWPAPTAYRWAFSAAPWYSHYGAYFAVSPAYRAPSSWLTDYFLALTMAETFQSDSQPVREPAPAADGAGQAPTDELQASSTAPISPQIKDQLAVEVQQQIEMESTGSAGLDKVLVPNHLFVAATPLTVATADGQTCGVAGGDVLQLSAPPAANAAAATLTVAASRESDCPVGAQVSVQLADLQDMQNGLREKLDSGMQTLHNIQGQGGLPAAPPAAMAATVPVEPPPPEDPGVQTQLAAAQQQATETESQVSQAATLPSLI
jgi:hypothetical protein